MPITDLKILDARFEPLPGGHAGWVMRVSGRAQKILHIATPFVARVGSQRLEALNSTAQGDRFEGYLKRSPSPGEELYVGYGAANIPTNIRFQPGVGPPIA